MRETVEYIGPRTDWKGFKGYTIAERRNGRVEVKFTKLNRSVIVLSRSLRLLDYLKEKPAMPCKNTKWEFNISREAQIEHDKIAEDLSWENPLALVSANGGELLQIVVYGPLYDKAMAIYAYLYPGSASRTENGHVVLYLNNGGDIELAKEWAYEVRQAPWPDAYKAKVKVQLLTL